MNPEEIILEKLKASEAGAEELARAVGVSKRTVFRYLAKLLSEGRIVKGGTLMSLRYGLPGTNPGQFVAKIKGSEPPLIAVQVTNPVTYLKRWWQKVMANEGVDIRFRIHPITMVMVTAVIASGGFVAGRITLPKEVVQFVPQLAPTPTPSPWKETAFTGTLQERGGRYYLLTNGEEAITLQAPAIVNMQKLNKRRVLVIGSYNSTTKVFKVTDASDIEIVTGVQPVPLVTPANGAGAASNAAGAPSNGAGATSSAIPR